MKIRTGFVTNSSSASSIEIVIENPLLLKILQQYKDMGVFGNAEIRFRIGYLTSEGMLAFHLDEGSDSTSMLGSYVKTLDEVLHGIIEILEDDDFVDDIELYDQSLYEEMKEKLLKMESEIKQSFESVYWYNKDWSWGDEIEIGEENEWIYSFDRKSGETYYVGRFEGVE